jgi:hypothetical protein
MQRLSTPLERVHESFGPGVASPHRPEGRRSRPVLADPAIGYFSELLVGFGHGFDFGLGFLSVR